MNLRVAIRSLWKSPAFALVSITVLALGIGANTAIFSVVNAVMLRPLPYNNPERIVAVGTYWPHSGRIGQVSMPDFLDWRAQSHSFETLSYYAAYPHSVFANNIAAQINCAIADTHFFNIFGVQPEIGRLYRDNDKKSDTPVAVVSDSFYRRIFQGNPNILGKTIKSGELELTIVGVMPPGFDFPERSEIWIPDYDFIVQPKTQERSAHNFRAVGLLKPAVSVREAQAEMKTIGARLAQQYPKDDKLKSVAVTSLRDQLVAQVRLTLYLLLSAVGVVLLIACANVANLMLAKVTVRRQEIAIRTALGASHGDIVRQLLTESLVLAVVAGSLGLLLGYWSAKALAHVTPAALIANTKITLDWRVASFALGVSLLCTFIFGLAPAFQASGGDLRSALYTGRTYSTAGGGTGKLRSGIMVAEIAMSMALLVAAGILIRSLMALNAVDPGYRVDHLSVLHPMYPTNSEADSQHGLAFYSALLESAPTLPGIKQVAGATALPSQPTDSDGGFWIAGHPDPPPGDYITQSALFMTVSPGYFPIVGIPIVEGRDFSEHDIPGAPLTCIISEPLARKFFPGENPIGQQIRFGYDLVTYKNYLTIVGVAAGIRQENLQEPPTAQIYVPYKQHPGRASDMYLIFADSGGGAAALRAEAHRLNPEVPLELKSLTDVVGESFAPSRFRSGLLASFAGLALILALAGLYGVMSYTVEQRRSEIGVRMALGAPKSHVMQLILGQALWLVLPGVAFGAALAFVAGKLFVSLVYGVKASDPLTFITTAALLVMVALLAMYIPARRAAQADPMLALRSE
jgi:putative ABC transport system permease protein